LRLDSPGGDALASNLVSRAVRKAQEKKPVIASLADIAASGGYYIAAAASVIFAESTTLTGSIGVFGLYPTAETLVNKIGVKYHELKKGENPGPTLLRHLTPDEHARAQALIEASIVDQEDAHKKYFSFLNKVRNSAYFLSLKNKFERDIKLSPGEYMYFALTTDDVNQLHPQALREMTNSYAVNKFTANIHVLIAALEWQQADGKDEFIACNEELKDALNARGSVRSHCEMFLNLHGMNVAGADLCMTNLDYVDLGNAELSHANLYDTGFHFSNLDHADLSYPDCVRPDLKGRMEKGPTIKHCSARHAQFNGMDAPNIDWQDSDFTSSTFENANIGPGCFTNAIFNDTDFKNGKLDFARNYMTNHCSLKGADFSTGKIIGADYSKLDLIDTKIFKDDVFANSESLQQALDALNHDLLDPIRNTQANEEYIETEITARKIVVADSLIDQIAQLNEVSNAEKAGLLDLALDHNVVQPEKLVFRMANTVDRSMYNVGATFFNQLPHHAGYTTAAMQKLEAARDQLIEQSNTPRV
jgi:uncharacterized protein YjbI with pentapeptide repeats